LQHAKDKSKPRYENYVTTLSAPVKQNSNLGPVGRGGKKQDPSSSSNTASQNEGYIAQACPDQGYHQHHVFHPVHL
jgi:hypothetical protein